MYAREFPVEYVDSNAIHILERLSRAGFEAYLVGGCVRDLLVGRRPKDFDIVTSARPRQAKRVLPRARIIGRRFRLVHVPFGDQIYEVSTFRREDPGGKLGALQDGPTPRGDDDPERILEDNTYGTPEEDARRRDLTVNALFFDPRTRRIIDHVGGLEDIRRGVIRTIGDPDVRFREDPIRILRAIRHAGTIDFTLGPRTRAAILRHRHAVTMGAPPRILEEVLRTFRAHAGQRVFELLISTRVLEVILPEVAATLEVDLGPVTGHRVTAGRHLLRALAVLDAEGAPLVRYLALLFLGPVRCEVLHASGGGAPESQPGDHDLTRLASAALRSLARRIQLPRRLMAGALRIVVAQRRFEQPPDQPRSGRGRRSRRSSPARFVRSDGFVDALEVHRVDRLAAGDEELTNYRAWVEHAREVLGSRAPASWGELEERVQLQFPIEDMDMTDFDEIRPEPEAETEPLEEPTTPEEPAPPEESGSAQVEAAEPGAEPAPEVPTAAVDRPEPEPPAHQAEAPRAPAPADDFFAGIDVDPETRSAAAPPAPPPAPGALKEQEEMPRPLPAAPPPFTSGLEGSAPPQEEPEIPVPTHGPEEEQPDEDRAAARPRRRRRRGRRAQDQEPGELEPEPEEAPMPPGEELDEEDLEATRSEADADEWEDESSVEDLGYEYEDGDEDEDEDEDGDEDEDEDDLEPSDSVDEDSLDEGVAEAEQEEQSMEELQVKGLKEIIQSGVLQPGDANARPGSRGRRRRRGSS